MSEIPDQKQPRVPGVRYGTATRYRPVKTIVFGEEHIDYEPYEVDVLLPPVDWDRYLLRFLLSVAIGSTGVAVVWSTASISSLLGRVVSSTEIAIAAASLFELLWLVCLVAEWLLRGQPDRAEPMRKAGWFAVMVVVAAVVTEGIHEHEVAAGVVGGGVSLMAKGSWWVVFRVRQVKLRRPVANALQRKLEDLSSAEALLAFKHRIGGRQAYAALAFGEDEFAAAQETVRAANELEAVQLPSGPRPDPSGGRVPGKAEPVAAPAVQAPPAAVPVAAPAPAPVSAQAPTPAPVSAPDPVSAPAPAPAPVSVPVTAQTPAPVAPPSVVPAPVASGIAPSIASTVRDVLARTPDIEDDDLVEEVRKVHGDRKNLTETVFRNRRAAAKSQSTAPKKRTAP